MAGFATGSPGGGGGGGGSFNPFGGLAPTGSTPSGYKSFEDYFKSLVGMGSAPAEGAAGTAGGGGVNPQHLDAINAMNLSPQQKEWLKWGLGMAAIGLPIALSAAGVGQSKTGAPGEGAANQPASISPIWPWMQPTFGDWLFSGFSEKEGGGWELRPLGKYPGQLNVGMENTRLPEVQNAWQPHDAGTMYLANMLYSGGLGQDPNLARQYNNIQQFGGVGGYPTELLHTMAQFGGTGGTGHQGIANALQFGAPSPAGNIVANRAQGVPTAANAYLQNFLMQGAGQPFKAPMIQPRTLYRRS